MKIYKSRFLFIVLAAVLLQGCAGRITKEERGDGETPKEQAEGVQETEEASGDSEPQKLPGEKEDWKNLKEETLTVQGLKRDYTFLFLTDMHLSAPDQKDSEKVRRYAAKRREGFQNASGISAAGQFSAWMREANERKVDAVLLGGDIIDYPSKANLVFLETELGKLQMPYLYTPGNHDWTFPWEYMTEEGKKKYLPMLKPVMQEDPHLQKLEWEDLIIAAVDDSANQIAPEAAAGYDELIQKKKSMIVMLHVPLFTDASLIKKAKEDWKSPVILGGGIHGGIYPNQVSEDFLNKTKAPDSPVAAVLAGHIHFADRGRIGDSITQIVGDAGYRGNAVLLHIVAETEG